MKDIILPLILAFLSGGGVAVAVIGIFKDKLNFKRQRQAEIEDREYKKIIEQQAKIIEWQGKADEKFKAQGEGIKFLLYDKIKYLGQQYIAQKEITFDDRKNLHAAHDVYHKELEGNGDFKEMMNDIDKLPLKVV